MTYQEEIKAAGELIGSQNGTWDSISPEAVARMRLQNRFQSGLDIARYTAKIMREDMAAYDADPANYTQSLGCWHGFIAQQKMISVKKHFGTTKVAAVIAETQLAAVHIEEQRLVRLSPGHREYLQRWLR